MDVLIELNELQVIKKNEGSADELFLWVAYIAADGTPINPANPSGNSVRINVPSGQHGNLGPAADDADLLERIAIPTSIGRFHTTLSRGPLGKAGEMVSLVGVVAVALEEDATKDSAIKAGHEAFVKTLQEQLTQAARSLSSFDPAQVTSEVEKKVTDAIKAASVSVFSFMPITSLLDVGGIFDPDDLVGTTVLGPFSYRQIASATPSGIPLLVDLQNGAGEEGTYRLLGRIRRRPIIPFGALFGPSKAGQHFVSGLEF